MTRSMVRVVTVLSVALAASPVSTWAAGVVGTGTATSCTDDALHTALMGGGLVTFNCGSAPVTIDLTSLPGAHGTENIAADTTIDGGTLITISGGNSGHPVFGVLSGISFTVRNVTIADGNAAFGGGIDNMGGTLNVVNTTFVGNRASNNNTAFGGGIGNRLGGTVTVVGSTFLSNTVTSTLAFAFAFGGGIYNWSGSTAIIANSTFISNGVINNAFSGNAFGGAIYNDGTMTIINSTFADNTASGTNVGGGGIGNGGTVTIINTIVANSPGGNCLNSGTLTDGGHNMDDSVTCAFTGAGCANTSGSSFCNTNPDLDPAGLQNNSGPTQTIALLPGSPAIDHGDPSVCAAPPVNNVDQRGLPRRNASDPICDIGAFEVQRLGTQAPVASARGLIGLVVLLGGVGWLMLRRTAR